MSSDESMCFFDHSNEILGDKEVSKCLLDLRVDGLIFDHVTEPREETSTSENLFICMSKRKLFIDRSMFSFQRKNEKN